MKKSLKSSNPEKVSKFLRKTTSRTAACFTSNYCDDKHPGRIRPGLRGRLKGATRAPKNRPSWDEYFSKIAMLVAERSTCLRHNVGAVIVKNKRILSTGYNGAPSNTKDCLDLGCLRDELGIPSGQRHEICRGVHAEQNAIIQASLHGVSVKDATLYCTHSPCSICAKMVVNAGIKRFVSFFPYTDQTFPHLFREARIEFDVIQKPPTKIKYKP